MSTRANYLTKRKLVTEWVSLSQQCGRLTLEDDATLYSIGWLICRLSISLQECQSFFQWMAAVHGHLPDKPSGMAHWFLPWLQYQEAATVIGYHCALSVSTIQRQATEHERAML